MSISKRQFEQVAKDIVQEARGMQWEEQWTEELFSKKLQASGEVYEFSTSIEGRVIGIEITPPTIDHPAEYEITRSLTLLSAEVTDENGDILELESGEFYAKMFEAIDPWTTETKYE